MKQARIHGPEWTKLSYVNMQMDMHSVGTPSFVESYTMWSNVYNWRATTTGIVSIYSGSESFLTSFKISQHEQNEAYVSTQGLANTKLANTKRDTHTERRTQLATYKATQRATRTKRHPRSDTNSDTASVTQSSDTRAFRARLAPLLTLWNLNSTISLKGSCKMCPCQDFWHCDTFVQPCQCNSSNLHLRHVTKCCACHAKDKRLDLRRKTQQTYIP